MRQSKMDRPVIGRLTFRGLMALAGIAGPVILVFCDYFVSLSDPGYNFVRHSISSLAWADLGWVQTLGFLAIGLLTELFVAALFFSLKGRRGFGFGIALLACFGFGLLMIGAFHTDPVVGSTTIDGAIHGIAAKFVFWIFALSVLLIAPTLRRDPFWKKLFWYSIVAAGLAVIIMLILFWMPPDYGWFGLFERLLVADGIIWVEVMAIGLLRLSLRQRNKTRRA